MSDWIGLLRVLSPVSIIIIEMHCLRACVLQLHCPPAQVFMAGVENLEVAAAHTDTHPTFVITIPYPDKRATRWGAVGGRSLNFSVSSDQVLGVSWYILRTISHDLNSLSAHEKMRLGAVHEN